MSGDIVIRVEGLGKKYTIGHESERERYTALRDVFARTARNFARTTGDLLRGRASVLTGPSGAGKSSLLNALEPGLKLRIGAISERRGGQGRHTTRSAVLVPLAALGLGVAVGMGMGGEARAGYVVDTPGLREVGTWGIDPELLAALFPEFRRFLDQCRFDNCRHLAEPGCAVREAAERGGVDPDRLTSYQRIFEEVRVPFWSSNRRRGR